MFKLTNEQRKCFGLAPINDNWELIQAKPSPYDLHDTFLYLDGDIIVKCILLGDSIYSEFELSEKVSPDKKYLLPKTEKGKPTPLSSSSILKRKGVGMHLNYNNKYIGIYSDVTQCNYYTNCYLKDGIRNFDDFAHWVKKWCDETTDKDIDDIIEFSQRDRKHIKYNEGDVFRFKLDRRHYGYGRILLDYDKMRKRKEPFWDVLMSKPVVCSVYHIVTESRDISLNELKTLKSLPSTIISDNTLFYGEYEIIGNIPISDNEDYPIMYGNSIRINEKAVCYQCGKTYRKIENGTALYDGFKNSAVSFSLNVILEVLERCIEENSNMPYWSDYYPHFASCDLRNPKHADKLIEIKKQFDLPV